jgi:diaminopimelate epimerase
MSTVLNFTKYQGTGNDFILVDNRERLFDNLDVAFLCNPKFGIGADGLMLLQNCEGFDFEMVYYNSDGKISSMCGNGGRCIVDFAAKLKVFSGSDCSFKAIDGPHKAVWDNHTVALDMRSVDEIKSDGNAYVMDTGSPHYVLITENVDAIDIVTAARAIRYNETYEAVGINVNFVEIVTPNTIKVRTYERGVENETLSCGTGVTASAIALAKKLNLTGNQSIYIETPGGHLNVTYSFDEQAENVCLKGPATEVFEGQITL